MTRHANTLTLLLAALLLILSGCSDDSEQDPDVGAADTSNGFDTARPSDTSSGAPDTSSGGMDTTSGGDTKDTVEEDTSGDMDTSSDMDTSIELDSNEVDTTPSGCGYGEIYGRVCSPNGNDWLFGVEVTVRATDCDGNPSVVQGFTDSTGFYRLTNVPDGFHTLEINTGSFNTQVPNVPVAINETTDLTGQTTKTCLDRSAARIAVLTGVFDNFQEILSDLGIQHSLFEGDSAGPGSNSIRDGQALLSALDPSELLTYDILIINSGEWYLLFDPLANRDEDIARMRANIQLFVQSGGSLYVSDWAYFFVEMAYPDMLDFFGDDTVEGSARKGALNNTIEADVLSEDFQRVLGGATDITLNFNWPAWVIIEDSLRGDTTIDIQARAIQTDDAETIVDVPVVISFKPSETSGTVYFTSFHADANEAQMRAVLRFLVFQL